MRKVESSDTVTLNYTGKLEDGTVFDTSLKDGREPLTARLGQGMLIKGFEDGLIGMSEGESKVVEIEPSNAYGEIIEGLNQEVPKNQVPSDVKIGDLLQANTQMGLMNFQVKEINEENVVLDANHPLAGKKLIFDLHLLTIE